MIVNHNANNDEIYVTTDDPAPTCSQMVLRTNDPNVSPTSFKTLYSYLLVSKATGKTLDFYTDLSCNLFRLEMIADWAGSKIAQFGAYEHIQRGLENGQTE